ncbi:MAG TPA: MFS transporter [Candidatus Limnocylindrales bacterium]|nr:MFS transporter [Candidatus Limnocylindrales bacterium]
MSTARPDATRTSLGRDFHLLWAGQSASFLGDRITLLVVPAVVVFLLGGSALDVGVISTAQYLAIPVLSLVAGALADQWRLRRMLIGCDLIRFVAVAIIPIAYWLGFLRMPLLFACVAMISVATVFFNIGYVPAIPSTVPTGELVRANSRVESSRTVAELGGPAVAGGLYQALGAGALLVDAVSYLISAATIRAMRPFGERSGSKVSKVSGRRLVERAVAGARMNWADPVLRKSTAGTLLGNIGGPIFVTQLPVLAYQGLGLSPGAFGIVMSIAAGGAVLGALLATRVTRWVGSGRMIGLSMVGHSAAGLGILAAPRFPAMVVLAATLASYGLFASWYDINSLSIRQARMPIKHQAVIHGAYRTITWGIIPISAFAGGWIVALLTPQLGVLDAVKYTMLAATVIGISSIIPLAGMQRLLDTAEPMTTAEPDRDDSNAAGTETTERPREEETVS